ncbi:MAG: hypothetical protein ACRCTA_00720, partial [Bacilli bacterium]
MSQHQLYKSNNLLDYISKSINAKHREEVNMKEIIKENDSKYGLFKRANGIGLYGMYELDFLRLMSLISFIGTFFFLIA